MAKKDDMKTLAELEIKTERPDPAEQTENADQEAMLRAAGEVGESIIRKMVQVGEEAMDRMGLDRDDKKYRGEEREDI